MTTIDSIARTLITNYDRSGNGAIELANAAELERVDRRDDGGSWHTARVSAERTFRAADRGGNRDGVATYAELVALGKRYDTGTAFWLPHTAGDGRLEGIEALRAAGEVGEEIRGVVGASGRQDGGGTFLSADQSGGVLVTAGPQGGAVLGGSNGNWFTAIGDALKGAWASRFGEQSNSGRWG